MNYRQYATLNVTIIGDSVLTSGLGSALQSAGHEVIVSGSNKHNHGFDTLFCYSIERAASWADLIILGCPPSQIREVSYWLGDVRGKVIIDLSPNNFSGDDQAQNTASAIMAITGSQNVVKALYLGGYEQQFKPLFGGEAYQLLLAGDCLKAKMIAGIMFRECGITSIYDFGEADTLRLFNQQAKCCSSVMQPKIAAFCSAG